jgi:co-chaperonin GroES (HSP10)
MLKPLPGRVLVELRDKYEHVAVTEEKYQTLTSGVCIDWFAPTGHKDPETIAVLDTIYNHLPGKLLFWESYREGETITRDGKKYAFIKLEDIAGYEDV